MYISNFQYDEHDFKYIFTDNFFIDHDENAGDINSHAQPDDYSATPRLPLRSDKIAFPACMGEVVGISGD